jgi:hypothetical protein
MAIEILSMSFIQYEYVPVTFVTPFLNIFLFNYVSASTEPEFVDV